MRALSRKLAKPKREQEPRDVVAPRAVAVRPLPAPQPLALVARERVLAEAGARLNVDSGPGALFVCVWCVVE